MLSQDQFEISNLGARTVRSPLPLSTAHGDGVGNFTLDSTRIRFQVELTVEGPDNSDILLEKAGPRKHLYFDPLQTRAAIVTCGGLCPGLNNVIRSVHRQFAKYGVKWVYGIRYGYQGLNPEEGLPPLLLTEELVEDIHKEGGTILGSSRGSQPIDLIVDFLVAKRINILITVGGDGTQRGALEITQEIKKRGRISP